MSEGFPSATDVVVCKVQLGKRGRGRIVEGNGDGDVSRWAGARSCQVRLEGGKTGSWGVWAENQRLGNSTVGLLGGRKEEGR